MSAGLARIAPHADETSSAPAFRHGSSPTVQRSPLRVSSPEDASEREATAAARAVVNMPSPPPLAAHGGGTGIVRRLAAPAIARKDEPAVQRRPPAPGPQVSARIQASLAGGTPLPPTVRRFMEPRFGASFAAVRIHTDTNAAALSRDLAARAFTTGNHVFFGPGQFQPDTAEGRELIAHELAHVVQQGGAPRVKPIQRSADLTLTPAPRGLVQRLGLSDALDFFAERAYAIPGFRMFTLLLGLNPINMSRVERSAANILRALIEFIPGGVLITQALDNYGVFDRVGTWVEQQIRTLGMTGAAIRAAIDRFLDSLSWSDIFDLGGVWERAKRIFTEPIDRIIAFAGSIVSGIIQFIKDAILMPLANLASRTRGWDLLCAVLGRNPITGEAVPRNAETLIGGFLKLIGQDEIWENIKRGNAIARAWAWFQGALSGLLAFVQEIPSAFMRALRALEIADIVLLPRAMAKVAGVFGGFIIRFVSWAGEQVWTLLQIIFEVVAPQVMVYVRRAGAALRTIIRDPIRFIGNLVRAGLQGLRQFAGNFLTHLRASLIGWLTGAMSGANIYIPQAFSVQEIVKFILSVLGLTWQNIRAKLVRATSETIVATLERTFDIVVVLVREGPAAAWQRIVESITNLRDMVMEQVMTFVRDRVVQAAITRLVTSLNPAGAFIQAIIAIYNTIMFFVERMRQIAQVAAAVIDSISAIASGVISAAANRVEQVMAGLLTLVISFLARIAGLGRVSDAVINIINRVRQPIDRALDRVVTWIVEQARRLGRMAMGAARSAAGRIMQWWRTRRAIPTRSGPAHSVYMQGERRAARLFVASDPTPFETFVATVPTTNPARAQAITIARQMDDFRNRASTTDGTLSDADLARLEALWDPLSAQLALCFTGTAATTPQYGPPNSPTQWGSGMVMMRLVSPVVGTRPTVSDPYFEDLNLRRHGTETAPSTASYYILGHLMNMQMGGLGSVWGNITPLSRTGNAQHDTQVESALRDPARAGRHFRYQVQVRYGRGACPLLSSIPATTTDPVLRNKRKVMVAEQYVPTSLLVRAEELPAPGLPAPSINFTREVRNVIDQSSLSAYVVPGTVARRLTVLALNDSIRNSAQTEHKEALKRLPGIGTQRVDELINQGTYRSWADVAARVGGVSDAMVTGWRAGLDGGAVQVRLDGTTTWV